MRDASATVICFAASLSDPTRRRWRRPSSEYVRYQSLPRRSPRTFSTRKELCLTAMIWPFREFPLRKTPQKGRSESAPEMQKPMNPILGTHGPSIERRGRDSNPRYPCGYTGFRDQHDRPLCHLSEATMSQHLRRLANGGRIVAVIFRKCQVSCFLRRNGRFTVVGRFAVVPSDCGISEVGCEW